MKYTLWSPEGLLPATNQLNFDTSKHKRSLSKKGSISRRRKSTRAARRNSRLSSTEDSIFVDSTEPLRSSPPLTHEIEETKEESGRKREADGVLEENLPCPAKVAGGVKLPGMLGDLMKSKLFKKSRENASLDDSQAIQQTSPTLPTTLNKPAKMPEEPDEPPIFQEELNKPPVFQNEPDEPPVIRAEPDKPSVFEAEPDEPEKVESRLPLTSDPHKDIITEQTSPGLSPTTRSSPAPSSKSMVSVEKSSSSPSGGMRLRKLDSPSTVTADAEDSTYHDADTENSQSVLEQQTHNASENEDRVELFSLLNQLKTWFLLIMTFVLIYHAVLYFSRF
ncbi:hypothetical protein ElyMa_005144900 [Elysia marginata]|uniref:CARMIL C-terminal domain-containing protein n=1 Tax=Elysia marginata TaxID=1093978 RepID=A0AAV4JNG0_9GAST|nr:hypothetical protein ElyMa_005144900 [Elysia marginata]